MHRVLKHEIKNRNEWLSRRSRNINSTDVAALFGFSTLTAFELYQRLVGHYRVETHESEAMALGRLSERETARYIAKTEGYKIRKNRFYLEDTINRMGASYDYEIVSPFRANFEIKQVDRGVFQEAWHQDEAGEYQAPGHIEIQVQVQMALGGYDATILGVRVGGNRVVSFCRKKDDKTIEEIRQAVKNMWLCVDTKKPPPVDYAADADFLKKFYTPVKDVELDLTHNPEMTDLAKKFLSIQKEIKSLTKQKTEIMGQFLDRIRDASRARGPGYTISAGMRRGYNVKAHHVNPTRLFSIRADKGFIDGK